MGQAWRRESSKEGAPKQGLPRQEPESPLHGDGVGWSVDILRSAGQIPTQYRSSYCHAYRIRYCDRLRDLIRRYTPQNPHQHLANCAATHSAESHRSIDLGWPNSISAARQEQEGFESEDRADCTLESVGKEERRRQLSFVQDQDRPIQLGYPGQRGVCSAIDDRLQGDGR